MSPATPSTKPIFVVPALNSSRRWNKPTVVRPVKKVQTAPVRKIVRVFGLIVPPKPQLPRPRSIPAAREDVWVVIPSLTAKRIPVIRPKAAATASKTPTGSPSLIRPPSTRAQRQVLIRKGELSAASSTGWVAKDPPVKRGGSPSRIPLSATRPRSRPSTPRTSPSHTHSSAVVEREPSPSPLTSASPTPSFELSTPALSTAPTSPAPSSPASPVPEEIIEGVIVADKSFNPFLDDVEETGKDVTPVDQLSTSVSAVSSKPEPGPTVEPIDVEPTSVPSPAVSERDRRRALVQECLHKLRVQATSTPRTPALSSSPTATPSSGSTIDTPFGPRRVRRVVVPEFDETRSVSRNNDIQREVEALRTQGRVGGTGLALGQGWDGVSLKALGTINRLRREAGLEALVGARRAAAKTGQ